MDAPHVWLIGCGNMGGAMLGGWLASGFPPASLTVIDPALERGGHTLPSGVTAFTTIPKDSPPPGIVVLAIKPQMLGEIAPQLAPYVTRQTEVISILAGVEVATLRSHFPEASGHVRVMPNMPAVIGQGVTVIHAADVRDRDRLAALFAPLGSVEWIEDEALFHAVTALSGSGPAFVFRFISALVDGAVALGLPQDQALRLAVATVEGSAALVGSSGKFPEVLTEQVRSPNGTTHAGLEVIDRDAALSRLIAETLSAAAKRSEALAAASR
jgi:pyrroline-5-carboxylate reductase